MDTYQKQILQILAGQSPGYFAYANASCFASEGHSFEETHEALEALRREQLAEREMVEAFDAEDKPITVPGGYAITDKGREALA